MAQFIDRHKRKGLLALLLLLFDRRKGLLPLLLLVFLLSALFVLPSGFLNSIPGASRLASVAGSLASKLGLAPSDERSFKGLLAAFRSAKDSRSMGWGMFQGRGRSSGESSIGLVSGSRSEFAGKVDAGKAIKGGKTIEGILTREDGERLPDGVAVTADELARGQGLVGEAYAEGLAGGAGAGGSNPGGAQGGYAGRGTLGENVKAALDATSVPSAGGGAKFAPTSGKLSKGKAAMAKTSYNALTNKAYSARESRWYSLMQLADGRARSQMAREEICKPPSCPPEYAAINVGAVFDGNHLGVAGFNSTAGGPPTIPSVPGLDGGTSPQIPSDNLLTDYEDEGNQLEQDAQTCMQADAVWGPRVRYWAGEIQKGSDRIKSEGCTDSSCSKEKKEQCEGIGNGMRNACYNFNSAVSSLWAACPMTANSGQNPELMDCSRTN